MTENFLNKMGDSNQYESSNNNDDVQKETNQEVSPELRYAREIAQNLQEFYPDWKEKLDNCPCTREEIEQLDNFEESNQFLQTYHPGADTGYRSTEPTKIVSEKDPSREPLMAGQQCTYDKEGNLITDGEAAGTPDAFSPNSGLLEFVGYSLNHMEWDVEPSEAMSLEEYHQTWTPNNGNDCTPNSVNEDLSQSPSDLEEPNESNSESLPDFDLPSWNDETNREFSERYFSQSRFDFSLVENSIFSVESETSDGFSESEL